MPTTPENSQTILIVDDDPDYQKILQRCLQRAGYSCVGCLTAEEALQRVKMVIPNLVILDLGLHGASGLAFLENLSRYMIESGNYKIPPVLVVSGYNDPEIIEFTTTLGACHFLPKPVDSNQLISAVRSFIN